MHSSFYLSKQVKSITEERNIIMKITKLGLILAAVATILFVAGCADEATPQPTAKSSVHSATYYSKLGPQSTKHDTAK